jgi:hypothetical protein
MWRPWTPSRLSADLLALRSIAEGAGFALACTYSSSAEFEAALIRSKLDAGVYGPKRRRRHVLRAAAATGMLIILILMF